MSTDEPAPVPEGLSDPIPHYDWLLGVLHAFAAAPAHHDAPDLVISQVVAALQATEGVNALVDGDRVEPLVCQGYSRSRRTPCGPLRVGDLSLPLTWTATTGEPVWLSSPTEAASPFPLVVDVVSRDDRAHAVLPLRAEGACWAS